MRVSSGVRGFDELVDGGFPDGRLYVISGPPGSGKTTFCAQFLTNGVKQNDTCVFLSMHETKREISDDMSDYSFKFSDFLDAGQIKFLNVFSQEGKRLLNESRSASGAMNTENVSNRILRIAGSEGVDRIVIDSMMLLDHFFASAEDNLVQFLTSLKQVDATVLIISEMTDPTTYSDEHYLAHGVVFFHNYLDASGMTRGVQIVKMRGTGVDCDIREIEFSDRGLRVNPDQRVQ